MKKYDKAEPIIYEDITVGFRLYRRWKHANGGLLRWGFVGYFWLIN